MLMQPIELDDGYYPGGYRNLIESAGVVIELIEDDDDYQGDSFAVVRDPDNGQFGYLSFGWGSCSGCDALQACYDNVDELTKLRQQLVDSIHWEVNMKALMVWFQSRDWLTKWEGHSTGFQKFAERLGLVDEGGFGTEFMKAFRDTMEG